MEFIYCFNIHLSLTLQYLIPFKKGKNPFPPFGFDGEHKVTLMGRSCDYKDQN